MDLFRWVTNPWSEQVLIGVSWDLFWAALAAGAAFVVGHAIFARATAGPSEDAPTPASAGPDDDEARAATAFADDDFARAAMTVPERVVRHTLATRLSHWVLALAVLTLLVTAFVPIVGFKFPWVTIHWVAGLVLAGYVVFHTVHALGKGNAGAMLRVRARDLRESLQRIRRPDAPRPGKWSFENKAFHHLSGLAGLAVVATGVLMMLRIRTPFWEADPYLLSDRAWGWIFVLHGLSAVGFVGLVMAHIYFAVRPEKRWITWSMFRGWISRRDYLGHHDPARWPVARPAPMPTGEAQPPVPATTDR